ncbi:MAG: exodeoxyribonuclease VII large subunit [Ruminococcus sp.]|nr:exodeoxyribonuclease VII large subunit [Ruminococcus sp.]
MPVLTVSQLNRYIALKLADDSKLRTVVLRGEVSNFVRNYRSGHCYFSLRDADASVRAVMFRSHAERLPFEPKNGMVMLVQASVTVYERDGVYQLNVTDMQPDGVGAKALALQQRREKLAKLGYFDPAHKRPLPAMPAKIGLVTSHSGAALQDMLQILGRRYPVGKVCIYPAQVQGDAAPSSIAQALRHAGMDGCDVILMGRGGGSSESLEAFQSEEVAHAVYHSPVPVISAVGHETDHFIADEIADVRASTPSAAAELATPDIRELYQQLEYAEETLTEAIFGCLYRKENDLDQLQERLAMLAVDRRVEMQQQQLQGLEHRLHTAFAHLLEKKEHQWLHTLQQLEAVSPVAVLQRGYSLVYHEKNLVRSTTQLSVGDPLTVQLAEGCCMAAVTEILPEHKEAACHEI